MCYNGYVKVIVVCVVGEEMGDCTYVHRPSATWP